MTDIILESLRVFVVGTIVFYLYTLGKREQLSTHQGWQYILTGFCLVLFGMVIDVTDNFESLNQFIIIGDTETEAFLEKVIGYLGGFIYIAIGFWKWMPTVIDLRTTQQQLKEVNNTLEQRVEERTAELQHSLDEIKTLRGILPVCSYCKQIRDDDGYWQELEKYLITHTGAEFSHGICPHCIEEYFPGLTENTPKEKECENSGCTCQHNDMPTTSDTDNNKPNEFRSTGS